jgi:hypothetical protein
MPPIHAKNGQFLEKTYYLIVTILPSFLGDLYESE